MAELILGDRAQGLAASANFHRIEQTNSADIFIAAFPKSGVTWVQHMVAGALFGPSLAHAPNKLIQDLVPDVHQTPYYRRYLTPTFFKTHQVPRASYRRVIHLVRDGRDALVSYHHYLVAKGGSADFMKLVTAGDGSSFSRWHEHTEAWLANPHRAEVLRVSYEGLKRAPLEELERICRFADITRSRTDLEEAVRVSSFEAMREKDKKEDWIQPKVRGSDERFVRRGTVGSHKDEMPAAVLQAFLELSAPTLRKLGYMVEPAMHLLTPSHQWTTAKGSA